MKRHELSLTRHPAVARENVLVKMWNSKADHGDVDPCYVLHRHQAARDRARRDTDRGRLIGREVSEVIDVSARDDQKPTEILPREALDWGSVVRNHEIVGDE